MAGVKYTEDECILALELYMTLERKDIRKTNQRIIGLSEFLTKHGHPRNVNSVKMKVENFKACDPLYPGKSLTNYSDTDVAVWNRFYDVGFINLAEAADEARRRISRGNDIALDYNLLGLNVSGKTTTVEKRVRVNQEIFRARVLTVYDSKCCITGMQIPEMLQACHIKPWRDSPENSPERIDPRNGLCLNKVHHAAFDEGLFTLDEHYRVELSPMLEEKEQKDVLDRFYYPYEGKTIMVAINSFLPLQKYLDFHRKNIFIEG